MRSRSPGLHPDRLIRLMEQACARCKLDLTGLTVLTEAATGAYAVTPVLAAMAGASRVYAVAKDSRFGSAEAARAQSTGLAKKLGLDERVTCIDRVSPEVLCEADIITNSGHVRPMTASKIALLKPTAVIALMYESWEFRPSDLDLEACHKRGIRVCGTNERHPAVGVFDFLGMLAVKLLTDAGICVFGSAIVVVSDNDFGPYIESGLRCAGGEVFTCKHVPITLHTVDAIVIAKTPQKDAVLKDDELRTIAQRSPGTVVAQFFGDFDREAATGLGIPLWPEREPDKGHMGILLSDIGPEPIVRLQAGGLKAGQVSHAQGSEHGTTTGCVAQAI